MQVLFSWLPAPGLWSGKQPGACPPSPAIWLVGPVLQSAPGPRLSCHWTTMMLVKGAPGRERGAGRRGPGYGHRQGDALATEALLAARSTHSGSAKFVSLWCVLRGRRVRRGAQLAGTSHRGFRLAASSLVDQHIQSSFRVPSACWRQGRETEHELGDLHALRGTRRFMLTRHQLGHPLS